MLKELVKKELIEAMHEQINMTLTDGARKNANETVKSIMTGKTEKALKMFNI